MVKRTVILFIILSIFTVSCSLSSLPAQLFATRTPSATPLPSATPTPPLTPTPTATPTPLPAARVSEVGERLLFLGDLNGAQNEFQTALDQAGDDETRAGATVGLGRTLLRQNNFQRAQDVLTRAIADYPESNHLAAAYFFRGQARSALEDYAGAAEDYGRYLELRPSPLTAYLQELRGDALANAGDLSGAGEAYQAAAAAPQLGDPVFARIKAARMLAAQGSTSEAVREYMNIYESSQNDYVRAQMDLLAGGLYMEMGLPEQAYARYQDAVINYPRAYDSYSALVALVDAGVAVNEQSRGLVDYYVGQYGVAIDAFERWLGANPEHDGTAHYYKALSMREQDRLEEAVTEFDTLIRDHPGDRFFVDAYREKAYTQWAYLDRYDFAAQTLLGFVSLYPQDDSAPGLLFEAARIQERGGLLSEAAATWERVMNEYPASDVSYRSLFLAGITHYRLKNYDQARTTFQRGLVLATQPADQAAALFWVGKTHQAQNNQQGAQTAWAQAVERDPTGYYSERARNLAKGRPVLYTAENYDLGYDLKRERAEAQEWVRKTFNLPPETILGALGPLGDDPRVQRGTTFWQLGLYSQARDEFESLRKAVAGDPANTFVLMNHLLDLGVYRSAILAARSVLDMAGMDDASSLNAPAYFNHIRFGTFFKDQVLPAAQEEDLHPLLMFSVIRQESLFEGFAYSSAGARGLMQIMPATGQEIVQQMGWPPDYSESDLVRPVINVRLGARYLARQREYFDGDLYAALAAYNGGPGNSQKWRELANDDQDLFLEIIRFDETRKYLMQIADFLNIYNRVYTVTP